MNKGCLLSIICAAAYVAAVFLVAWAVCLCFDIPFRLRYGLGVLLIATTARTLMVGVTVKRKEQ